MKETRNAALRGHVKGNLYALILSLGCVAILALVVKFASLPTGAVKPIVQVIKVLSIFLGVMVALRGVEKRGWLHGGILGIVYTVLAFFVFSVVDGDFSVTAGLLTDMLFAVAIGVISACLVNFRRARAV